MMKKILALSLVLIMGLTMTGCARSDVVAMVGKTEIHLAEAQEIYNSLSKQMLYMYSLYGIILEPGTKDYETFEANTKMSTLSLMTEYVAMEEKLDEFNLSLTDEELLDIEVDAQVEYDQMVESFLASLGAEDEETKEENRETAQQMVEDIGYSYDALCYLLRGEKVEEKLRDAVGGGITLTEEEVEAKYTALLAEQEERYAAEPDQYARSVMNGDMIYTHPAGYRYVKNLLIGLPEETSEQIAEKSSELMAARTTLSTVERQLGEEDAPVGDEKAALEAQQAESLALVAELEEAINTLREQGLEEIREHTEEVLALCREQGADFDALMQEYSIDLPEGGTLLERGYPVWAGSLNYVQSFTDGAMALANVGDISDPVASEYGFHIILYTGDAETGAVPLEAVRAAVSDAAFEEKEEMVFSAQKAYWLEKADIRVYTNRFKVN